MGKSVRPIIARIPTVNDAPAGVVEGLANGRRGEEPVVENRHAAPFDYLLDLDHGVANAVDPPLGSDPPDLARSRRPAKRRGRLVVEQNGPGGVGAFDPCSIDPL